jgi:hypothetical protein
MEGMKGRKEAGMPRTDIFFTQEEWKTSKFNEEFNPDGDHYWVARGRPYLWIETHNKNEVQVWQDVAYGRSRLRVGDKIEEGVDLVCNQGYVFLSDYYDEATGLYKKVD